MRPVRTLANAMVWSTKSLDGGDDGANGGDEEDIIGTVKMNKRRHLASNQWTITAMLLLFLITGSAAVLSNSTFKGTIFTNFLS